MQLFTRGGTLISIGVAASFFLAACQTGSDSPNDAPEAPPALVVDDTAASADDSASQAPKIPSPEELAATQASGEEKQRPKVSTLRTLARQASAFGATVEKPASEAEDVWRIRKGERVLELKQDSRIAKLDGIKVFLDTPFVKVRGHYALGLSDQRIILKNAFEEPEVSEKEIRLIAIDPGHGGTETGTANDALGLVEKSLNLDVALRLKAHLETMGFETLLTRYDDRLLPLPDRPALANANKADLFVSIHFNGAGNPEANGLETFMLTPQGVSSSSSVARARNVPADPGNRFNEANFRFAYEVHKDLLKTLGREDRGIKKGAFAVLRGLDCPGILVEGGFVTHAGEARLIGTAGYRERLASSLANSIQRYAAAVSPIDDAAQGEDSPKDSE